MPSRVTGFAADTPGRPAYTSHPPPPPGATGPGGGPPSPSSAVPSTPYYGYAVGPSSSYESHPPPSYPPRGPPRAPEDHGRESYERGYSYGNSPEAQAERDHYRRVTQAGPPPPGRYPPGPYDRPPASVPGPSSPPLRKGSYDHQQHDYGRAPEVSAHGVPPLRSRSSGSVGSASPQGSPPRYAGDIRPPHGPPHGYSEVPPPHQYIPGRAPPRPMDGSGRPSPPGYNGPSYEADRQWGPPDGGVERSPSYGAEADRRGHYDDERAAHDNYSWGASRAPSGPYAQATYHPPHSHARRPLNTEYSPRPQGYDAHSSRQASDATHDEGRYPPHNGIANGPLTMQRRGSDPGTSHGPPARALSPTQVDSSRRDEVANMGCTCKKSRCLKLYCICFGASVVCGPNCRCLVCYNTPSHDAERKEAVRSILARNPTAFDTKFKKAADKVAETVGTEAGLAHKLGCKCRKSACVKRYCECFQSGVKCSASCRCVGCQNMPPGGFSPDPRYGYTMAVRPFASPVQIRNGSSTKSGEPWMVDAAQNLAFLKHASPHRPEGRPLGPSDTQGIASMPSLVSSDTTPTSDTDPAAPEAAPAPVAEPVNEAPASQKSEEKSGGVANALLMAAYAMTELQTDAAEPPSKPHPLVHSASDPSGKVLRASPKRKTIGGEGPFLSYAPNGGRISEREHLSVSFDVSSMGPPDTFPVVVKQNAGNTSPLAVASEPSLMTTPSGQPKIKRTRVGSEMKPEKQAALVLDDTPRAEKRSVDSDEEAESKSTSFDTEEDPQDEMSATPAAKTPASKSSQGVLTPVSARCIDFRQMDVNELDRKNDTKDSTAGKDTSVQDESKTDPMEVVAV